MQREKHFSILRNGRELSLELLGYYIINKGIARAYNTKGPYWGVGWKLAVQGINNLSWLYPVVTEGRRLAYWFSQWEYTISFLLWCCLSICRPCILAFVVNYFALFRKLLQYLQYSFFSRSMQILWVILVYNLHNFHGFPAFRIL